MFHGHLNYFKKPPLGDRPNKKVENHDTPKSHKPIGLLYTIMCEHPDWIEIHWNNIWLRAGCMTSHYTWEPVTTTWFWKVSWDGLLDSNLWALTIWWSRAFSLVCEVENKERVGTRNLRPPGQGVGRERESPVTVECVIPISPHATHSLAHALRFASRLFATPRRHGHRIRLN